MKKKKTSELIGPALDWAVAKCEGVQIDICALPEATFLLRLPIGSGKWRPSLDWSQGGPIIECHIGNIWKHNKLNPWDHDVWTAVAYHKNPDGTSLYYEDGPTALIAAMRCYVSLKLGDEVDLPEELCAL